MSEQHPGSKASESEVAELRLDLRAETVSELSDQLTDGLPEHLIMETIEKREAKEELVKNTTKPWLYAARKRAIAAAILYLLVIFEQEKSHDLKDPNNPTKKALEGGFQESFAAFYTLIDEKLDDPGSIDSCLGFNEWEQQTFILVILILSQEWGIQGADLVKELPIISDLYLKLDKMDAWMEELAETTKRCEGLEDRTASETDVELYKQRKEEVMAYLRLENKRRNISRYLESIMSTAGPYSFFRAKIDQYDAIRRITDRESRWGIKRYDLKDTMTQAWTVMTMHLAYLHIDRLAFDMWRREGRAC